MPTQLLVLNHQTNFFQSIHYKNLEFSSETSKFVEEGPVSPISTVVGHTWQYINKDGKPDLRFHDNPKFPIVLYSEIKLESIENKFNLVLQATHEQATREFVKCLIMVGSLQNRVTSNGL